METRDIFFKKILILLLIICSFSLLALPVSSKTNSDLFISYANEPDSTEISEENNIVTADPFPTLNIIGENNVYEGTVQYTIEIYQKGYTISELNISYTVVKIINEQETECEYTKIKKTIPNNENVQIHTISITLEVTEGEYKIITSVENSETHAQRENIKEIHVEKDPNIKPKFTITKEMIQQFLIGLGCVVGAVIVISIIVKIIKIQNLKKMKFK